MHSDTAVARIQSYGNAVRPVACGLAAAAVHDFDVAEDLVILVRLAIAGLDVQIHLHVVRARRVAADVLTAAADDLLAAAPWLDCGPHEETIRRSHDAFDAVIAALTARAASRGQTCPPGQDDLAAATTEGWIAIPDAPIGKLI